MLLRNHGASTLGKTLRRPVISTFAMSSKEGQTTFATGESMRAMATKGARNSTQLARPSPPAMLQRTWSPQHGIVFAPRGITYRGLTTETTKDAIAEIERAHMLHSNAEDNYVMASANMIELKSQSNGAPKVPMTPATVDTLPKDTIPVVSAETKNEVTGESTPKELSLADLTKSLPVHVEPQPQDPRWNHLPQTSTAFRMTEELFRKAKDAEPGETGSFWSHTLYRKEPDLKSKPLVHYCRSLHTTERVLKTYFADQKLLGFDIEWKPDAHKNSGPKANVSLIQIASEDRIVLIHLALFSKGDTIGELVAPTLKTIMEDPEITKIGVSIKSDCTRVRKWLGIDSKGLFELSHLYKLVKFSETKEFGMINKILVSLARQVQEHLHLPMFKGQDVRSSDWSKPISMSQLLYAAGDSYAAVQLYHTMELKRKALDPMPPRPYNADQGLPIRLAEGVEISTEGETEEIEPDLPKPKRKYTKKADASKETAAEMDHITMEDPDAEYVQYSSDSTENESSSSSYSTGSISNSSRRSKISMNGTAAGSLTPHQRNILATAEAAAESFLAEKIFPPLVSTSELIVASSTIFIRSYFLWSLNPSLPIEDLCVISLAPWRGYRRAKYLKPRFFAKHVLAFIDSHNPEVEPKRVKELLGFYHSCGGDGGPEQGVTPRLMKAKIERMKRLNELSRTESGTKSIQIG